MNSNDACCLVILLSISHTWCRDLVRFRASDFKFFLDAGNEKATQEEAWCSSRGNILHTYACYCVRLPGMYIIFTRLPCNRAIASVLHRFEFRIWIIITMTLSANRSTLIFCLYKYIDASRIARTDLPVRDVNETMHSYAYLEINLHSSGAHI